MKLIKIQFLEVPLNKTGSENQVEISGNSLIKVNVLLRHIN